MCGEVAVVTLSKTRFRSRRAAEGVANWSTRVDVKICHVTIVPTRQSAVSCVV